MHRLLHREGLGRYYELRGGAGVAVDELDGLDDLGWADPAAGSRVELDVQGVYCAACVWLLETLCERHGAGELTVSVALGRASLRVAASVNVRAFVEDAQRFGIRLRPARAPAAAASDDLLLRMGICTALAGNGMMYALAGYLGLSSGPVHEFFGQLAIAAATLSVLVGGSHFILRSARALARGVVSLDLPIALGVVLAYGGALTSFLLHGEARYADTLSVFVALMLGGRWLRERALERDRALALACDGSEHIRVRRIEPTGSRVEVPIASVRTGDRIWLERGALVPTAAVLEDGPTPFRLDWIDGESQPRTLEAGQSVPAGAFQIGASPVVVQASEPFSESALGRLLTRPMERARTGSLFWRRSALALVSVVLSTATIAGLGWALSDGAAVALEVSTAILVVSCPCAFGLAAPMAYELVAAQLRQRGVFIQTGDVLDRALGVRHVVVDKTGTLTTGRPRLLDEASLDGRPRRDLQVLATLACSSTHPKAQAIAGALADRGIRPDPRARPIEVLGRGIEFEGARLGDPKWIMGDGWTEGDLAFDRGDGVISTFQVDEELRRNAHAEVSRLRTAGLEVCIASGDRADRVRAVAQELAIETALGELRPEAKARWLETQDPERCLFLGDGLNDAPAVATAGVSGCAALDRPFMAARTDFFVTGAGMAPIGELLDAARKLRQVLRQVFAFALAYNLVSIGIAAAGWMSPWLAAIVMPVSSLVSLTYVGWRLGPRASRAEVPLPASVARAAS